MYTYILTYAEWVCETFRLSAFERPNDVPRAVVQI